MKKVLLILLGFAFTCSLFSEQVNNEQVSKIARNFYLQIDNANCVSDVTLTLVYTETIKVVSNFDGSKPIEIPVFYIFNVNDNSGFVIVTADDDVIPILGYSTTGNYSNANLPPAFKKLLENYKKQIQFVIVNDLKSDDVIKNKWSRLDKGDPLNTDKNTKSVDPLLETTWNQSPYYNDLCPYDYQYWQLTLTGCTATAMAQIMKYWNYPNTGVGIHSYNHPTYGTLTADFGSTTYNWTAMPNNVNSTNMSVATLMYHCGVSVEMNYGVLSSGAWVICDNGQHPYCAENAYKTYFGYNPNTIQGLKRENYTTTAWKNLLIEELDNNRPLQYVGFGLSSGHTFVCDGYNNSDFFHMNWGWGGQADGFFSIDDLTPLTHNYNSNQQAVIGIQPQSGGSTSNIDMYSSITISPNPIDFYNAFTVNADVINSGNTSFNGDYCAAIFNEDGLFIDFVEILSTGGNPLPPGYHYTGGLTFLNNGLMMVPGNYIIGIYYRETGGQWQLAGNDNYDNPVNTSVTSPYNLLEQYSEIVATPTSFVQGQSANVNVNLYNTNDYTYYGQYQAAIYDFEGNFVETISILNETNGLPPGYTYSPPYLNFSTAEISAEPGTYLLTILEKEEGSPYWYFVGGSYFTTPVYIIVEEASLSADIYEPNNSLSASYNLPITFSGNTATNYTTGSNIHSDDDVDYYKINLDPGYDYNITARIHDSYNSGNGQTYTCDVLFAYNQEGSWSDYYDDIMPSTINVSDGGTLYFYVAPYFAGEKGTYLLDMIITRTILLPDPAGPINGPITVCQTQSNVSYHVATIPNATSYIWTLPQGASGNSNTNNIVVNYSSNASSGNISVMGHNSTGNGPPSSLYITVNQKPSTPTITLNGSVLTSSSSTGNQWYDTNGAIEGATSQNYTPNSTGDYYVVVTLNGCSSDPSNSIHVIITEIIDLSESESEILIYPNPVKNELFIEVEEKMQITGFEIINSMGEIIYKSPIVSKSVLKTMQFPQGIYLIRFKAPNSFIMKQFIKL